MCNNNKMYQIAALYVGVTRLYGVQYCTAAYFIRAISNAVKHAPWPCQWESDTFCLTMLCKRGLARRRRQRYAVVNLKPK